MWGIINLLTILMSLYETTNDEKLNMHEKTLKKLFFPSQLIKRNGLNE